MIYDGNCGFCTKWIQRWSQWTRNCVDYAEWQKPGIRARFPEIPVAAFETSVQFVDLDGRVHSGAAAVFQALSHAGRQRWLVRLYRKSRLFAATAEWAYRFIADHRRCYRS